MGKYIVELKKNETLYKAATRESDGTAYVCSAIGTPYTEPDLEQVRKEGYENGYENGFVAGHLKAEKSGQSFYEDGYQRGLADAWEAARKIGSDSRYGLEKMGFKFEPRAVWDDPGWYVVQRHSASECIERIRLATILEKM